MFNDIEEVFEVYDYLTPEDAKTVLRVREERGFNTEDFKIQFLKSFRRAPVIPQDEEMEDEEEFEVYPRANLFLVSDVERMGQTGLYNGLRDRKPFLNPWDDVKSWDSRMTRKSDPDDVGISTICIEDQATNPSGPRPIEAVLPTDPGPASTSSMELCQNSAPSEAVRPEDSQFIGSDERAVSYNLRSRQAAHEIPLREPGLHGLGHQPLRSTSRMGSKRQGRLSKSREPRPLFQLIMQMEELSVAHYKIQQRQFYFFTNYLTVSMELQHLQPFQKEAREKS